MPEKDEAGNVTTAPKRKLIFESDPVTEPAEITEKHKTLPVIIRVPEMKFLLNETPCKVTLDQCRAWMQHLNRAMGVAVGQKDTTSTAIFQDCLDLVGLRFDALLKEQKAATPAVETAKK